METFLATVASGFASVASGSIATKLAGEAPSYIIENLSFFGVIFVIAFISNIIRAYRNCWKESYGIEYGIWRGIIIGITCVLSLIGMNLSVAIFPMFGIPAVQGVCMGLIYLFTYLLTYPAYEAC